MLPKLRFSQRNLVTAARLLMVLPIVLFSVGVRPPTAAAATGVTITWNNVHQTIDGFGASGAFRRASYLMNLPEPGRTAILDALFSQTAGAGLSIVRNVVNDGSSGMPTIEPSLNTWVWTGDADQIWLMQQAQTRGATRFLSTVWTPPAWMKDNGSVVGGSLATAHYQHYADYLSRYVREYQSRFGLNIYAVSLANEPCISVNYSSCCWTGAQFRDFIKNNLRAHLSSRRRHGQGHDRRNAKPGMNLSPARAWPIRWRSRAWIWWAATRTAAPSCPSAML